MIAVTVTQLYTAPNAAEWALLSAQATKLAALPLVEMPGWSRTVGQSATKRQVTVIYKGSQAPDAGF